MRVVWGDTWPGTWRGTFQVGDTRLGTLPGIGDTSGSSSGFRALRAPSAREAAKLAYGGAGCAQTDS
eukprot:4655283-Prymnesium_polylepis.2